MGSSISPQLDSEQAPPSLDTPQPHGKGLFGSSSPVLGRVDSKRTPNGRRELEKPAAPATFNPDLDRLAQGAATALAASLAARGLNLATQALLARMLGPRSLGLYAIGTAVLQSCEGVARLGLSNGVVRFGTRFRLSDKTRLRETLFVSLALALCCGAMVSSLLFAGAPWLARRVFGKPALLAVLRWFAAALPVTTCLRVAASATRISLRMKFSAYAGDLAPAAVNLLLVVLLYWLGRELLGAVLARVLSLTLAALLSLFYLMRLFPGVFYPSRFSARTAKLLLAFSIPTAIASILTGFVFSMDRLFVGAFCTAAEAGIYQASAQIAVVLGVAVVPLNTIFVPMAADLDHRHDPARLESLFRVSTKWGLYASLPLFLTAAAAPREILRVLYGEPYAAGASVLRILLLGQVVNAAVGAAGSLLNMSGHPKCWAALAASALGLTLALNVLLVPRAGIAGAAVATSLASVFLFSSALRQVRRRVGVWPYDRRYAKGAAAALVTAACLLLLRLSGLADAALVVSTAIVSFAVFALSLGALGLDPADRRFLARLSGLLLSRAGNKG